MDEVSARLAASLAIFENGKIRFGAGGSAALSHHHYVVGHVLDSRKSVDPKAFRVPLRRSGVFVIVSPLMSIVLVFLFSSFLDCWSEIR